MRLIDADALFEKLFHAWGTEMDAGPANDFMQMINDAPTITPPPNDPLTLDELREMDGEPVWIEWGGHPQAGWALVRVWSKATNIIYLTYHNGNSDLLGFVLNDGGKVYRRKPEEVGICQKTSSLSG